MNEGGMLPLNGLGFKDECDYLVAFRAVGFAG